ncbi:delta fatty acid desaturase, partial [Burkholderia sp. Ax-1735]|nr:delta fatty acid desaturase [Burkholderia sp. Ax-1735]
QTSLIASYGQALRSLHQASSPLRQRSRSRLV